MSIVLKAIVYAYNPLSMTAISTLMQMPIEKVEAALAPLHSLIHIPSSEHPEKNISILHVSFHDFISNKNLSLDYYLDPCTSHADLAFQCLLLIEEKWSGKKEVSYLAERRHRDISEPLAYACSSWAFHFTHGHNNNGSAELKDFFQRHLL